MNVAASAPPRSSDRRLFAGAALCIVAIVFAGFARTYFLRPLFFREMLLATLSLLTPAIARLPLHSNLAAVLLGDLCVVLCVAVDVWLHRRLHPAFAIGAPLILIATYLAYVGVGTDAWMNFARSLVT